MEEESDNVKVIVRVRPMNAVEIARGDKNVIHVDCVNGEVSLKNSDALAPCPPKVFKFDHVFDRDSKQVDVYNAAARKIVDNVLEGYNGTIFAYGQTGTGKTFTMEGNRDVPELRGILPNSFAHIFGHIARAGDNNNFLVRVSYLEIYNEEVRDLLVKDQRKRLEVRERADIGVYVKDLSAFVVNNADDLDKIMTIGKNNRSVGSTNMNEQSSRSHAIFTITIECSERGLDGQQHVRMGKLNLVDLAGSERQSKTGATGDRFKEATKINLSLSTLGNVISSLVDGKRTHIPYRDSKLTRLLMDSLGGNAKTLMVANVGPADYNCDETLGTLRYANRAKNIQNHAKINEDPKDALLRQFQEEIEELRRRLRDAEDVEEAGDESPSGDEEDEEGAGVSKKRYKRGLVKEIEEKIAAEKRRLEESKGLEERERERVARELKDHEKALASAKQERSDLMTKLKSLQKKVIVGGENLLEKAEAQEKLLEESQKELEDRQKHEARLKKAIEEKEAERLDMEEKYSSLQEEAVGKTKKIARLTQHLAGIKAEVKDVREDHQREIEGLLDNVRQLARELQLQKLVIDSFIPQEYQNMVDEYINWNEDIGEWQLKCVAYTGNNMRKLSVGDSPEKNRSKNAGAAAGETNLTHMYISYAEDGLRVPFNPDRKQRQDRPKTAAGKRLLN